MQRKKIKAKIIRQDKDKVYSKLVTFEMVLVKKSAKVLILLHFLFDIFMGFLSRFFFALPYNIYAYIYLSLFIYIYHSVRNSSIFSISFPCYIYTIYKKLRDISALRLF